MDNKKVKKIKDVHDVTFDLHEYNINIQTREIFLHPYYHVDGAAEGDQDELDFREAVTFVKNLSLLNANGKDSILIHQESAGGSWNHGMAIFDAIKSSPSFVTMLAYAHARSMSSLTLQAADLRILMPNCDFVIHYGFWAVEDRVKAALTQADYEKKIIKNMLDIYVSRCDKGKYFKERDMSKSAVLNFIKRKILDKGDWIMSAAEAINYGFADGILGKGKYKTLEKIR